VAVAAFMLHYGRITPYILILVDKMAIHISLLAWKYKTMYTHPV
jgi:hypothetical protein